MEVFLSSSILLEAPLGKTYCVLKSGCSVPTSRMVYFTTLLDAQTSVEVKVLRGEGILVEENEAVAKLHISGLPPAPKGAVRIEIGFHVDQDGNLSYSAEEYPSRKPLHLVQSALTT